MTSRVTQCPKCQTSFRVTDAQLDIANGAVRCGSCLHIFNAPEHWLGESTTPESPPSTKETTITSNDSFDDLLDDDDFMIDDDSDHDDLFDDEEELNIEELDDDSSPDNLDGLDGLLDDTEDNKSINDTAQQSAIQKTDQEPLEQGDLQFDIELSDSFLDMDNWEDSPTAVFKELQEIGDDDDSEDADAWAEQLLADDEDEDEQESAPDEPAFDLHPELLESTTEVIDEGPELDSDLLDLLNEAPEKVYNPYSDQPTAPEELDDLSDLAELNDIDNIEAGRNSGNGASINSNFSAGERIGEERLFENSTLSLLDSIEPEPVELVAEMTRSRRRSLAAKALIIAALLGLPLQYINYNFDRLAREPQYRPWFQSSCPTLGCQLPELHDISQVKSSNLMVRSHPKSSNALVVDAMMTNRADFKQPFPTLELQFTDIHGQIVAGRRFQPSEYLAGELTGSRMMPARQPIHISLAIIDPGSAAVNYQLKFLPQN